MPLQSTTMQTPCQIKLIGLKGRLQTKHPTPDLIAIIEVMPKVRHCDILPLEYHLDGYIAWSVGLNEDNQWGILAQGHDKLKLHSIESSLMKKQ